MVCGHLTLSSTNMSCQTQHQPAEQPEPGQDGCLMHSLLLALPRVPPWPLGRVGGHTSCCPAGQGPCKVLSGVCGARLVELRSAQGTVWGGTEARTAWSGAPWTPRGDDCVEGPPSPTQPLPVPADTHIKDAAACPSPGIWGTHGVRR